MQCRAYGEDSLVSGPNLQGLYRDYIGVFRIIGIMEKKMETLGPLKRGLGSRDCVCSIGFGEFFANALNVPAPMQISCKP